MRVMWVCNGPASIISEMSGLNMGDGPSWIEGLLSAFGNNKDFDIAYCFPQNIRKELVINRIDGIVFYGFFKGYKQPYLYSNEVEKTLRLIINEFHPDILHIFGTEFSHSLAAVNAFNNPDKTLVSIQGLCHMIARHYYSELPGHIINHYTFRDLLRNDSIKKQALKFKKRGENEKKAIRSVSHVTGRTDFDRACCLRINPMVEYHFCNEVLRESFYNYKWDISKCERHSIFLSQCYYPIKGLHFMLEALAELKETYLDVHLYIAGTDITKVSSFKDWLRITSYGKYLRTIIKKYKLEKFITFTGQLDESAMRERFLSANVFISASSIENSPNSVGEAMILGVPTVCSDVGGLKNLVAHNEEGFIYQWNAPYMIAYYINRIFEDDELAISLSKASQYHANSIYDREINSNRLNDIYKEIINTK